jgi:hypothetical protein
MSIQRTAFPLVLDANDFQRIDRGMKWGIKLHETISMGVQSVHLVYVGVDGSQKVETLEDAFDLRINREFGGDVLKWLRDKILPKLNDWLTKTFPPTAIDDGFTPVIDATDFEAAFAAISKIKITVNADGTLKASVS